MRNRGPSPIVPSVMVGVLGLVIFGPTLMSLLEYVLPLFQGGDEPSAMFYFWTVLPLLLLLLVHLISSCFPIRRMGLASRPRSRGLGYDADGYGFGSLLLLLLFIVLYNVW